MPERRYRVLVIASHPVQYAVPNYRLMAQHRHLDTQVAYCSMRGAEADLDPEFGTEIKWDIPLLDGYAWKQIPNEGTGAEGFFGLRNPELWRLIRGEKWDAIISYVGYTRASFWIAYFAARSRKIPFIFGTDASSLEPRDGQVWKHALKILTWPIMFRLSGQILTASTAGHRMMCSLGIPESRISMTLDTVDNDWWIAEAARADREMVRRSWNVGPDEKVILFCAKLQPWKCPMDVLQAFAKMGIPNSKLVFAGDGAMRSQLEAEAQAPGLAGRVRFLGFVNQSQLPGVYKAADLMVIASRYEPFGLVVNEAMLCGCAVVASDRVGAVADLVTEGRTGFVYRCGDIDELADALAKALGDPGHLSVIRAGAFERMKEWSPSVSVKAVVDAVARAVARAGGTPGGQESTGGAA